MTEHRDEQDVTRCPGCLDEAWRQSSRFGGHLDAHYARLHHGNVCSTSPAAPPDPSDPTDLRVSPFERVSNIDFDGEQEPTTNPQEGGNAMWNIVTQSEDRDWPCTVVDEHGKSLLAVHNGTPVIRDRALAERIAQALNARAEEVR